MTISRRVSLADWRAIHGAIFLALLLGAACLPVFRVWPLLWLVPLAGYGALVAAVSRLRATFRRWRFGRVTGPAAGATAVLAIGSCAALVGFQALVHPELRAYRAFFPVSGWGGVIVAGAVFSLLNALCEEIVFRGIFFDALEAQWGAGMACGVTALLFGYCHMHGYPPGLPGAVLACGYGLTLGWLRVFTGGLGLPVIAHMAADATIYALVTRPGIL